MVFPWQKKRGIIEPLEQRIVLATFTWAVPGSGAWESAANWELSGGTDADGVPDADDDVIINASGAAVVTVSSARAANSLSVIGDDQIRLTAGSLALSAASAVSNLAVTGGTLTSSGLLTLTGASSFSGNAQVDGNIRNEGTLTLTGDPNLGAVLQNAGTILSDARLDFTGGGRLNNLVGGVFEIIGTGNGSYSGNFGGAGFFNEGIFRHSGSASANLSTVPFNNAATGQIEVAGGGALQISSAGAWEGAAFLISANSTFSIAGGAKTWTGTYIGSGAGAIQISAGTITIGTAGATFSMPDGLLEIGANAEFIGSPIANTGHIQLSGDPDLGVALNNSGTIRSTARLDFVGGGQLNNLAGGVFEITGAANGSYAGNFGGAGFFNSGVFRHIGTGNADLSTVPFHNLASGKIEVTGGGTLQISSNGTWEGADWQVTPGSTLRFGGGTKTWTGSYIGAGGGNVLFNAGTITIGAEGATLNMPLGFMTLGGNAEINGAEWSNLGGLMFTGDVNLGSTLNNFGTILSNGQIDFVGNGQLNNRPTGLFEITGATNGSYAGNFGGSGFFNEGIFRHSGIANANLSTVRFNNAPDGRIELTGGGTLQINSDGVWEGATILADTGTTLIVGGGTKVWTGDFSGSGEGQVRLTNGTITIGGAGATFDFPEGLLEIGGDLATNGSTLQNQGFIRLSGDPNLGSTLENHGTVQSTARLDFVANGRLNNLSGATFEIAGTANGSYAGNFGGAGIFNAGTFRHAGIANANVSTVPFHNSSSGIIEVTGTGVLQLNSDGAWGGAEMRVTDGSTLILGGGTKTWTGNYTGSGDGLVRATAGTVTVGAAGATLNFPVGMFEIADTAFAGAATLNTGALHLTGDPNLGNTLNNAGVITSVARLDFVANGRLNNLAGGLFDIVGTANGSYFGNFGGPGIFNAGVLRHSGGGGANMSTVAFNNLPGGQIEVADGTLTIGSSGLWQGAQVNVAAGAVLDLGGGTKTWTGEFTGGGAGVVRFDAGTITGGPERAVLRFPQGLLTISGNATLNGEVFSNEGWIHLDGDPNLSATLANSGTITSTARLDFTANGRLHNLEGGLFEITGSSNGSYFGNFGGPGLFNEGILRYSGGGNANTGGVPLSNAGTVEVSIGSLSITGAFSQLAAGVLTGGTWRVLDGATLSFPRAVNTNAATIILDGPGAVLTQLPGMTTNTGSLSLQGGGDLVLTGGLVNTGTLAIGPGSLLTVNGAFSQPDGGLKLQIADGGGLNPFGQVAITGAATLGGTLAIKSVDGYSPDAGDGFSLLTYGSRTGDFQTFEGVDQSYNPVFEVVIGADEVRINSLVGAADLAVSDIAAPLSGFIGNEITVSYTVTNLQDRPTPTSEWTDVIYLSRDGVLDASDYLFARIPQSNGLGALASYTETITSRLPGAIEGEYQIFVVTDNRRVSPDLDRGNNLLIAGETITVDFAELAFGTPSTGTIQQGQDVYFRIDIESGRDVFFTGDFEVPASAEFLVRYKAVPDRVTYDFSASSIFELEQQIRLLNPRGGAYYVMLHGREGAADGVDYTILADDAPFEIDAIGQTFGANVGQVTIPLTGAGFTPGLAVELRGGGGGVAVGASKVEVINAYEAFATFDLAGQQAGTFDVVGLQGDAERFLDEAFEVREGEPGRLEARLTVPEMVRMTRPFTITVDFENRGGTDIPIPLLTLQGAEGSLVWAAGQSEDDATPTLQFLGADPDGLSGGVLRPGEKHSVVFNAVTSVNTSSFTIFSTSGTSTEVVNYETLLSSLRPESAPTLYDAAFLGATSGFGPTYGDLIGNLAEVSDEAKAHGANVRTFSEIVDYLVQREILSLPTSNVRGTLFVEDTAHVAPDEIIYLTNTATGAIFQTSSFHDGRFAFTNVPEGLYALEAQGFLSSSVQTVQVSGNGIIQIPDVVGDVGETLSGRVVNSTGRAVANAYLNITDALGNELIARTDANGRYTVNGVAAGEASIDLRATGLVPVDDAAVVLISGSRITKDFTLHTGGTISGRVLNPAGAPTAGAELVARLTGSNFSQVVEAGFDGRFRLSGLPAGTYELVATAPGFGAKVMGEIVVGSSTVTPVADVQLSTPGKIIGVITDSTTGLPIPGAKFAPTSTGRAPEPFLSGSNGAYVAEALTTGSFTALFTAPGYHPAFAQITLDSGEVETIDVALRPLGGIDGSVQVGGSGAAGLKLKLLPLFSGPLAESYTAVSGENGAFSFTGLPDGEYALSLDGAGGTLARETFLLDTSDNTHTTTLNLGASKVSGAVRAADGTPLAFEAVSILRGGQKVDTVLTDADGHYRFLVLQDGEFDVVASGETVGVSAVRGIQVLTGQPVTAPDIIAGGSSLTVDVNAASNGSALGGTIVVIKSTLTGLENLTFGGFTDAEGKLALSRLLPGEYEIAVTKKGFATEYHIITIAEGAQTLNLDLTAGRVIHGTVRSENGAPVVFAEVTIVDRANGDTFVSYTDAEGNYRRDTLRDGSFDVLVAGGEFRSVVVNDVTVGPDALRIDAALEATEVSLSGVVSDQSGDPLAQVLVRLLGPGDITLQTALTAPDGSYTLENLPSGDVRIGVTPNGFAPSIISLTLPSSGQVSNDFIVAEAVALGLSSTISDTAAALPKSSTFVAGGHLPVGGGSSVGPRGIIDGSTGDFASGLQPPARFDADTAEFRFGLPLPDEDCPEQRNAHSDALDSAFLVNQAFDAYSSSFDALKGLNDADVAEFVTLSKEILLDGVNLADGVSGFKDILESYATRGTTIPDLARENVALIKSGLDGILTDVSKGRLPSLSDLTFVGDQFKSLLGLGTDVDFNTGEVSLGGDFKKVALGGTPIIGDIVKLYEKFNTLNDKVTKFVDGDLGNRLGTYEEAHDRYLEAVLKHDKNRAKLEAAIASAAEGKGCGSPSDPDPDDPDDKNEEDEEDVPSVGSRDPNDILGPKGFGPKSFVAADQPLDYTIRVENVSSATAAAQQVFITQQLDADVDPSTLQLGSFGFAGMTFEVPAGHDFYSARLDVTETFGVFVDVEASLNVFTGILNWTFSTIDPETLDLTADPIAGFLPPNLFSPEGEGFVSYSIHASEGSPSGTVIDAQATIVFDQNEAIDTPAIFHTLDAGKPSSTISALPAVQTAPNIVLNFTSGDEVNGSGLHSFDVYVSTNGSAYELFLNDFSGSSALFRGENGQTYSFATVAKDNVGNTEILPLVPDATTTTDIKIIPFDAKNKLASFLDANGDRVTIKLKGPGNGGLILDDPDGDGQGNIDTLVLNGTTAASKLSVSVKKGGGGDGLSPIAKVQVDGSLGAFTAKNSDLVIEGFTATGAVKSIAVRDLAASTQFAVPKIEVGGAAADSLRIAAARLGEGFSISTAGKVSSLKATEIGDGAISAESLGKLSVKSGPMNADLAITGAVGSLSIKGSVNASLWSAGSFGSINVKGGEFDTDVETPGAIGKLSVTGGHISGEIEAGHFGAISIKSGDFTGTLVASDSAESLGKIKALKSLKIAGGDLAGDIHLNGEAGGISVQTAKGGLGGSVEDSRIVASRIASLIVGKDLSDSMIIAGAHLGTDRTLGGIGDAADRFGSGEIGKVQVKGDMTATILAAGLSSTDAVLGNDDDSIIDSASSRIASIIVTGTVSADSYFAAGVIAKQPRFDGVKVEPSTDGRFLVG